VVFANLWAQATRVRADGGVVGKMRGSHRGMVDGCRWSGGGMGYRVAISSFVFYPGGKINFWLQEFCLESHGRAKKKRLTKKRRGRNFPPVSQDARAEICTCLWDEFFSSFSACFGLYPVLEVWA